MGLGGSHSRNIYFATQSSYVYVPFCFCLEEVRGKDSQHHDFEEIMTY